VYLAVNAVTSGTFSLVTASSDKTARLWVKEKCVKTLRGWFITCCFALQVRLLSKVNHCTACRVSLGVLIWRPLLMTVHTCSWQSYYAWQLWSRKICRCLCTTVLFVQEVNKFVIFVCLSSVGVILLTFLFSIRLFLIWPWLIEAKFTLLNLL